MYHALRKHDSKAPELVKSTIEWQSVIFVKTPCARAPCRNHYLSVTRDFSCVYTVRWGMLRKLNWF